MADEFPPLIKLLRDELGYRIRRGIATLGYDMFTVDLSEWRLRFSNRTPFIWVKRADLQDRTPQDIVQSLQDVMRERGIRRDYLIVLLEAPRATLAPHISNPQHRLLLIGTEEQERILHSRRPSGELLDVILAQMPIALLAPYETSAPVTGSRFFGRSYEIARVIGNPDSNFLVLGIRRIGKTSLLQEIQRRLEQDHEEADGKLECVFMDCSDLTTSDEFIREVVRKLNPRELPRLDLQSYAFFFPDFLERMARMHKTRITFFLDEIDNLIMMQRGHWDLLNRLRASANKQVCRYVIAGFGEAMKEANTPDSPFLNFAQDIRLSEFSQRDAYELIVEPLERLRVHLRNRDQIVARIFEETSGHPNLIQYYCMVLLKRLDERGEREISADHLIDVHHDEGFKSRLLNSFLQNTRNRDKLLVYAALKELDGHLTRGFSQAFMDAALRRHGVVLPQGDIDETCDILIMAGILRRKTKEFSLASPIFANVLLENYALDYLLKKAKEEGWHK